MNEPSRIVVQNEKDDKFIESWLVLVKHKRLFILAVSVCMLLGFWYAYTTPVTYLYTSAIQIGTTTSGEDITPIEDVGSTVAKINYVYRPAAKQKLMAAYGAAVPNTMEASLPGLPDKGGRIVVLQSKGASEQANIHQEMHNIVTQMVIDEHSRLYQIRNEVLTKYLSANGAKTGESTPKFFDSRVLRTSIALADKTGTYQVAPMTRSHQPLENGQRRVLFTSVLLALLAGALLVFLAETVERIKYSLSNKSL